MAITTQFASLTRPGVFISEGTAGYRVLEIASHTAIYMVVSGTNGPYNDPTLCTSLLDFTNQFGGSLSEAAVRMLFRNDPRAVFYAVRAAISPQFAVTIDDALSPSYTVTINGTDVTYVSVGGDTVQDIAAGLIAAINADAIAATVTASPGDSDDTVRIRLDVTDPLDLTVTVAAGNATATDETGTTLKALDYVSAIENTFDHEEDWPQGFLLAPEAFQNLTNETDRLIVGTSLEALASDPAYDWVALVDCGPDHDTVAKVQTEHERYVTPEGHTSAYAPYLLDLEGLEVPASAAICAIATTRFREEGYQQPMAGAKYPIKGVTDVTHRFGNTEQSVLNPLGINLVRYLRNKGVVAWGMRTRSNDEFYTFTHTRVIMNVLNGTLRSGFDNDLFTSVDGQGVQLARIEETARSVCNRMWIGRALFGENAADAYEVKCDFENNLADDLEQGNVVLQVWVAPSPAIEKLLILTRRVPIGQVQSAADSNT